MFTVGIIVHLHAARLTSNQLKVVDVMEVVSDKDELKEEVDKELNKKVDVMFTGGIVEQQDCVLIS